MAGKLEGKVAVITGTGGGQGRAAAIFFAREGAKVVGCDVKARGAEETLKMVKDEGGEMVSLQPLDLTEESQVKNLIGYAIETYGRIDILYNNAASARFAAIDEMTLEDFHYTLRNELDLVYLTCHYAWPYLKANKNGVILNTASIAGIVGSPWIHGRQPGPGPMFSHCTGKGGVRGMTRELALQGGPLGIRVIAICPGVIQVESVPHAGELEWIPIGRLGGPEDIAKVAVFLASDDASYITGVDIIVDGGITAH